MIRKEVAFSRRLILSMLATVSIHEDNGTRTLIHSWWYYWFIHFGKLVAFN